MKTNELCLYLRTVLEYNIVFAFQGIEKIVNWQVKLK